VNDTPLNKSLQAKPVACREDERSESQHIHVLLGFVPQPSLQYYPVEGI